MSKRRVALFALTTSLLGLVAVFPRPGVAQVEFPGPADFAGYSTGTAVHTDALTAGPTGPRVLNIEEAFSGASVASQGTNTINQGNNALPPPSANRGIGASPREQGRINNELGQQVQPNLPTSDPLLDGNRSFARGSGLEIGLGNDVPASSNPVPVNKAQVSAPPSKTDVKQAGPVEGDPLVFASLLRGEATANWDNNRCILGQPISTGMGHAANVELLNTGTGALPNGQLRTPLLSTSTPNRAVAESRSTMRFVTPTTSDLRPITNPAGPALLAETRQTLAPVTIGKNTPGEVTIEIGGEWVLQAVAGGTPGSAYVRYAPGTFPSPTTPLLRILRPNAPNPADRITEIINFQDLFGPDTLPIPLLDIPGVLRLTIGENPRPIDSDNVANPPGAVADPAGLFAHAAVDVARVQLLDGSGADIRIGHMEAQVRVPAGGIRCRAPIAKDANPRTVNAGNQFTYDLDISNPFTGCTLTNVRVTDTISATQGVTHTIVSTEPAANSINPPSNVDGNQRTLVWNDVGPIAPNSSRRLRITVRVSPQSRSGSFTDTLIREGQCAGIPLGRETVTVNVPSVNGTNPPNTTVPTLRPPIRPRATVIPPPRMRPPVIIPPRPLPILPPQPAVLRTDIVRPALPFTGSTSLPLLATAALLLALGFWLKTSSYRFGGGGGGGALAFAGGGGPTPSGGPTLFQSSPESGATGTFGVATRPRRRRERPEFDRDSFGHDLSLLDELGIDVSELDLDELFDDVRPAEVVPPVASPHDIAVAAPSLLSPEVETPQAFDVPVPPEPLVAPSFPEIPSTHGFVVDSSGTAEETVFDAARDALAVPLFDLEPEPVALAPIAPPDRDSLSLHVALHWATAPRVEEPQTWGEPEPVLFTDPAPALEPEPIADPAPVLHYDAALLHPMAPPVPALDVDVSRPPAGLPNLRHAMFLGGAALAVCAIKILKDHHQRH